MSSTYAAYCHHQIDYRQLQFAHHPSQPIYQPPHHHPSQPIYQPPHHPIGSLDLQQSYPQDRHFHPQYHPYQARQPTCWEPPWVRTQQSSLTYDQSPPHGPYLAYGEATYQGSYPNNPDIMARSFSPAQLAAVNDYNEKLRVYRLDQAALLARLTAWFEENTDDENITEENIDNTFTMVLSADVPKDIHDVPNSITDVSIKSLDAASDFQKDLEEQRVTDEKKGHFMGDRNQILSKSDQFSAPANASPSIVTDPMAAQSRVSLANHKTKALLSKNLVAILDEGGGEMNAENFGNLDCSKTSYFQIQNEEGRFDYHRLHAAENKGRIVASRGGADSNSNLSNISEFNDNGDLALGDPQSAEKDGSIMASHGETFPHSSSCIILNNDKEQSFAFDPGGDARCSSLFIGFHLEDKVNFNRGGVDTIISSEISPTSLL